MTVPDTKPLHIIFTGRIAKIIRQHARAQGVTYAGIVRQSVKHTMDKDGGETVPVPFGMRDFEDCIESKNKCGGNCKCK